MGFYKFLPIIWITYFRGWFVFSPAARVSIDKTLEMFIFMNFFPARHGNPPSGEFLSIGEVLVSLPMPDSSLSGLLLKAPLFKGALGRKKWSKI